MSDKDKLREAMDAIVKGEPLPDGVLMHVSHAPTQADWDALDPDTYDTTCRDCGSYYEGRLPQDRSAPPPKLICPHCGSARHGSVGSPAGASSLAMWLD